MKNKKYILLNNVEARQVLKEIQLLPECKNLGWREGAREFIFPLKFFQ